MDWEKMKFGLLSATGGAIVLTVIGFNWGWLGDHPFCRGDG